MCYDIRWKRAKEKRKKWECAKKKRKKKKMKHTNEVCLLNVYSVCTVPELRSISMVNGKRTKMLGYHFSSSICRVQKKHVSRMHHWTIWASRVIKLCQFFLPLLLSTEKAEMTLPDKKTSVNKRLCIATAREQFDQIHWTNMLLCVGKTISVPLSFSLSLSLCPSHDIMCACVLFISFSVCLRSLAQWVHIHKRTVC